LVSHATVGASSQTNTSSIQNSNVSKIPQSIGSLEGNVFGESDTITIANSGNVFGGPNSDSVLGILALGPIVDINNTGLVHAYSQGPDASATGIGVVAAKTTITNRAGTIWAGFSTDDGSTIQRGIAIDTVNVAGLIQLQGTKADGHIYGDINIARGNTIEVTEGKTFFEGTINGAEGTLDVFDGGGLVLCQEGWTDSCDPNGWGDANWDPQQGLDGPSSVFIDTFTIETDGTVAYQLTPRAATGTYPQVFAYTANLGGTLEAQFLPGFYADKSFYDNIIEAGDRNGTFDAVEDNSLLLKTNVIYDGDNVDLRVERTAFDHIKGLTKNQDSAAGAIENVYPKLPGPGVDPATTNPFEQLVSNLFLINDKRDYAALLDQLSGSQFAQELQSVLWSLRPLNESITDRMDCGLNQSNIGPIARGYDDKALGGYEPVGCFRPGHVQAWARVWGGWNNNDGDVNAPSYDERQWGIWGGADYALGDTVVLGVAGGFFRSDMDFERFGGVSGGSIEYDGGQIAGYAGWDNAVWYNRATVSTGFYDGESHRNVAFNRPAVDPSGSPDADAVAFYNEAGRRFALWNNITLTPFAGITVAHAKLDGFTENDRQNTGAALKISDSDADSVASILGLRFNGSWGAFEPKVAVGWEHEFDDTSQIVKVSFAGAPSGSNFKVIGTDLGEDAVVVDAGASYTLGPASDLSVRYIGRFLEEYDAQSVMGRWTYKFGAAPVAANSRPIINPSSKQNVLNSIGESLDRSQ
jgi:outer membrane autotransporter protein